MAINPKKKFRTAGLIFLLITSVTIITLILMNQFYRPKFSQTRPMDNFPESFTFFHLGANTQLTIELRDKFRKILGSVAISQRTTIDFEIHYQGFLSDYFKPLNRLNQKLNNQSGERIEYNTVQLTYRYPPETKKIFKYVRILFSNYNHQPLMVEINSTKEGAYLLDNLKEKYGKPNIINFKDEEGKVVFWKRHNDYLIVSVKNDRYGNPVYIIKIYFADNISALYNSEQLDKKKRQEKIKQAEKSVFS